MEKLVLVNGSHGQVFATAFQPLLRIPVIHDLLYSVINMLQVSVVYCIRYTSTRTGPLTQPCTHVMYACRATWRLSGD